MTKFPDFHKIALLESKKNCNLEIVQYDETNMVDHTFLQPKIINSSISDSEFLHFIENDIQEKTFFDTSKDFEFLNLKVNSKSSFLKVSKNCKLSLLGILKFSHPAPPRWQRIFCAWARGNRRTTAPNHFPNSPSKFWRGSRLFSTLAERL